MYITLNECFFFLDGWYVTDEVRLVTRLDQVYGQLVSRGCVCLGV